MKELFAPESVAMDSPKLAWMKKHGIITCYHAPGHVEPTWFAGFQDWWPDRTGSDFFCEETMHNGDSRIGEGETETEALAALCAAWEIKLWNEEQP